MKVTVRFKQGLGSPHPSKIEVIKAIRYLTDAGLKESKHCSEGIGNCIGNKQTQHPAFDRQHFVQAVDLIRSTGGDVYIASNEWNDYEDEIKKMLFIAKMKGHDSVTFELEKLLSYVTQEEDDIIERD